MLIPSITGSSISKGVQKLCPEKNDDLDFRETLVFGMGPHKVRFCLENYFIKLRYFGFTRAKSEKNSETFRKLLSKVSKPIQRSLFARNESICSQVSFKISGFSQIRRIFLLLRFSISFPTSQRSFCLQNFDLCGFHFFWQFCEFSEFRFSDSQLHRLFIPYSTAHVYSDLDFLFSGNCTHSPKPTSYLPHYISKKLNDFSPPPLII